MAASHADKKVGESLCPSMFRWKDNEGHTFIISFHDKTVDEKVNGYSTMKQWRRVNRQEILSLVKASLSLTKKSMRRRVSDQVVDSVVRIVAAAAEYGNSPGCDGRRVRRLHTAFPHCYC